MSTSKKLFDDFFDRVDGVFSGMGDSPSRVQHWKGKYFECLNELQKSNRALARYSRLAKARRKQIISLNNALDEVIRGLRGRRSSAPRSPSDNATVILSNTTPPELPGLSATSTAPSHSKSGASKSA